MAGYESAALGAEAAEAGGREWMRVAGGGGSFPDFENPNGDGPNDAPAETNNSALALVAGPFLGDVSRIWPGRRMGEYLTAPDARRHLWHACLAAEGGAFRPGDRDAAGLAYARFTAWKGKHLIAQAYGVQPPGLLRSLGRLGPKAIAPEAYRALVGVMAAGGAGARFLSQPGNLAGRAILTAAALPPPLRSKRALRDLAKGHDAPEEAAFFGWCVARLETLEGRRAVAAILASPKPVRAMAKVHQALPFPAPPWPGDGRLRPVASRARLTEVAEAFGNCLSHYATQTIVELRAGRKCLYEWCGAETALIEFTRWPPLGWRMTEAKGPKNAEVSARTRAEMLAALSACPEFAPVWPTDEGELLAGL